jgi:hypothetical protein
VTRAGIIAGMSRPPVLSLLESRALGEGVGRQAGVPTEASRKQQA